MTCIYHQVNVQPLPPPSPLNPPQSPHAGGKAVLGAAPDSPSAATLPRKSAPQSGPRANILRPIAHNLRVNARAAGTLTFLIALAIAPNIRPAQAQRQTPPSTPHSPTLSTTAPATQPVPAPIIGHVIDAQGKPVYQAIIIVVPTGDLRPTGRNKRGSATDHDGNFRIPDAIGEYLLRAYTHDRQVTRLAAHATAGATVTLIVEKDIAPIFKGRVLDANGKPIKNPPRLRGFGGGGKAPPEAALPWVGAQIAVGIELMPGSGNFIRLSLGPTATPTYTDENGNYFVEGFFPDLRSCVFAFATGYPRKQSPLDGPFKPGETRELPDIVLSN
ncbi:MAG TPA: hypothetical protein VIM11_27225 [Tepidisphaeraceae bacterium]|jgi:hypothetical protein